MTSRTEERLRDATNALASTLRHSDIPPLYLPDPFPRTRHTRHAAIRPSAARWLVPVAAAASLAAVVSLVTLPQDLLRAPGAPCVTTVSALDRAYQPGGNGRAAAPAKPRYLVSTNELQAVVRASATARVVGVIKRPANLIAFVGVAAAADDRTFFLAEYLSGRNGQAMYEFSRVVLSSRGHPSRPRLLPGRPLAAPGPVSPYQAPLPIAVSPGGQELAFGSVSVDSAGGYKSASYSQRLIIQDVATGCRRSWSAWSSARAGITPLSWTNDGRLAYVASVADAQVRGGRLVRGGHGVVNALLVLNTAAKGSDLIGASHLVTAGKPTPPNQVTPGPYSGVISPDGTKVYADILQRPPNGQLAELSATTGRIVRVLVSSPRMQYSAVTADGSGRYLLFTRQVPHPVKNGTRPYVSGHLAALDLATGRVTELGVPVMTGVVSPSSPVLAAW